MSAVAKWVPEKGVVANRLRSLPGPTYHSHLVEGLSLVDNFITSEEESSLINSVELAGWDDSPIARCTRQYGAKFDHVKRVVTTCNLPIPPEYAFVNDRLKTATGISFTQMIINKYNPNQGIGPHIDDSAFGPVVAVISLGSKCVVDFTRSEGLQRCRSYILNPTSLLIMEQAARLEWRHGIAASPTHTDGRSALFARDGVRWSLTFRTCRPRKVLPALSSKTVHARPGQSGPQEDGSPGAADTGGAPKSMQQLAVEPGGEHLADEPGDGRGVARSAVSVQVPIDVSGDGVGMSVARGLVRVRYQKSRISFSASQNPLIDGVPIVHRAFSVRGLKILEASKKSMVPVRVVGSDVAISDECGARSNGE